MIIDIINQQKTLRIDPKEIDVLVRFVLKEERIATDEVAVHFITSRKMIHLHKKFFDDPTPTDCISLPMDKPKQKSPYHCLGEIFVCPQTAINYVKTRKKEIVMKEVFLYVIHALLHLLGYDDIKEKERRLMKKREEELLKKFYS